MRTGPAFTSPAPTSREIRSASGRRTVADWHFSPARSDKELFVCWISEHDVSAGSERTQFAPSTGLQTVGGSSTNQRTASCGSSRRAVAVLRSGCAEATHPFGLPTVNGSHTLPALATPRFSRSQLVVGRG